MKKILIAFMAILFAGFTVGKAIAAADYSLADWAFFIDGAFYDTTSLPSALDASAFDWSTGLGTLQWSTASPGSHRFAAFFDHEIDESINTFFNEYGETSGIPISGQSWEIDEPDYVLGDSYTHMQSFTLDNSNGIPSTAPDDVSMALGWVFDVNTGEMGTVRLSLAPSSPGSGFYLAHTDPDSAASIYYQGTVQTSEVSPIPERATVMLFGLGLVGLAGIRRKYKKLQYKC